MRRRALVLIVALSAATLLAGCSGASLGSGAPAAAPASRVGGGAAGGTAGAGTAPAAAAGSVAGSTGQISARIVNLYSKATVAGPSLDIYDTQEGVAAKPLLTGLAYGAVSDYVHPLVQNANGQQVAQLYVLPAGEDPVANKADAQSIGGVIDDGSHPQETVLLLPGDDNDIETGPLAGLSFSSRVEKGDDNGSKGPVAPPATGGQGEILVDTSAVENVRPVLGLYLFIDDSCNPPLNGDPNITGVPYVFAADGVAPVSSFAVFAAAPGSHQLSLVNSNTSTQPQCADLTARQAQTSASVTAGQQIEAYVYGTSATDLHLALAPVQQ